MNQLLSIVPLLLLVVLVGARIKVDVAHGSDDIDALLAEAAAQEESAARATEHALPSAQAPRPLDFSDTFEIDSLISGLTQSESSDAVISSNSPHADFGLADGAALRFGDLVDTGATNSQSTVSPFDGMALQQQQQQQQQQHLRDEQNAGTGTHRLFSSNPSEAAPYHHHHRDPSLHQPLPTFVSSLSLPWQNKKQQAVQLYRQGKREHAILLLLEAKMEEAGASPSSSSSSFPSMMSSSSSSLPPMMSSSSRSSPASSSSHSPPSDSGRSSSSLGTSSAFDSNHLAGGEKRRRIGSISDISSSSSPPRLHAPPAGPRMASRDYDDGKHYVGSVDEENRPVRFGSAPVHHTQ